MLFRSLRNYDVKLKRRPVCLLRCLIYFCAHMGASDLSLQGVEISKLEFMFQICQQTLQPNGPIKCTIARNRHNNTLITLHVLIASISMMDGNQKN